ncbi:MAG: hypothetical protein HC902_09640 [Calothrix sp. SM1_5_4]|nr:hypothetical protein [Calothrix sp. SM1_5_4]
MARFDFADHGLGVFELTRRGVNPNGSERECRRFAGMQAQAETFPQLFY